MLPLVLGGVALAAVSYGIKQYCEKEGCPWDSVYDYGDCGYKYNDDFGSEIRDLSSDELFEKLYQTKLHVYDTQVLEFNKIGSFIENYPYKKLKNSTETFKLEKSSNEDILDDLYDYQDELHQLSEAQKFLEMYINRVKKIVKHKSDYEDFNEDQQKTLELTYELTKTINKLIKTKMFSKDGESNSKHMLKVMSFRMTLTRVVLDYEMHCLKLWERSDELDNERD